MPDMAPSNQAVRRQHIEVLRCMLWPLGVGLAALVVFWITLAPTVTSEDSGELIAAAWHFGIPHPPGYPLWTMLCGLFVHAVRIGSIAYRANLFSAVCTAGAAVALYLALRQLNRSRSAAASVALVWVWARWSWCQAVITEVYGLNSLLTAGFLLCVVRWYATRSNRALLAASLILGLGMCNHHTIALAGVGVVAWILLLQPRLAVRWRLVLGCWGMLVLGLVPYVYLPVRASADPAINWEDPSTMTRFVEHVTRHQYGAVGPMKTAEPRSIARIGTQLGYLASSIEDDLTPWLLGASVIGLLVTALKDRRVLLLLLLWIAGSGLLFVILANYDLDRTSRWAMRVFLIPVSIGPIIALAYLIDGVAERLRHSSTTPPWLKHCCAAALVLAGPALQIRSHWSQCNYRDYWYAYDHGQNLLRCMLPNAMIFPSGDHTAFPLTYLVLVEGQRNDVLIADIYGYTRPDLLIGRPSDSAEEPDVWLIKQMRRPVYFTVKKAPPVGNATLVPAGVLYHLLPRGMPFDDAGLLEACKYRNLGKADASVVDFGACQILVDYHFFGGLNELRRGQTAEALRRFEEAATYGRGIKEAFNNLGSVLAEHGLESAAIDRFERAAALDWRYALPRWNLFRIHKKTGQWEAARRQLTEIIRATPDDFRAYGELGFLLADSFGDRPAAEHAWKESLQLNPDQPQIIAALAERRDETE